MGPFLKDVATLTLIAAAITIVFTGLVRLGFRQGKKLEEP